MSSEPPGSPLLCTEHEKCGVPSTDCPLPAVFLPAPTASAVLGRWRRAGSYLLEEIFEGNLEKECYEEICAYEEAREVFEHDEDTVSCSVCGQGPVWQGTMPPATVTLRPLVLPWRAQGPGENPTLLQA